jgi:hypothetical protein
MAHSDENGPGRLPVPLPNVVSLTVDGSDNTHTADTKQVALVLHYGNARTPLAVVVPDPKWPGMWRVRWPDGTFSDITNLSRAKDAAAAILEGGPPRRDSRRFKWTAAGRSGKPVGALKIAYHTTPAAARPLRHESHGPADLRPPHSSRAWRRPPAT